MKCSDMIHAGIYEVIDFYELPRSNGAQQYAFELIT